MMEPKHEILSGQLAFKKERLFINL